MGNYTGQISIGDSTFDNTGSKDIFICKFNSNFDVEWANHFGTKGNDYITDFALNEFNAAYITGTYRTQIEINSKEKTDLFFNPYILKFNNKGDFRFIYTIDDSTNHYYNPQNVILDNNNILVSGNTSEYSATNNFLYEFYDCDYGKKIDLPEEITIYEEQTLYSAEDGFSEYLWSNGVKNKEINLSQRGIYYLTTKDQHGCVSVDTMNVEIFNTILADNSGNNRNNNYNKFEAEIFPNPASYFIDLKITNIETTSPVQVFVISETGAIVYYKSFDEPAVNFVQQIELDINSGNYLMKIVNNQNIKTEKIIIIK
ncbi:MAG: T9SS type A sorting domain-containing protein [Bacteroidales bacterium]|nr:T9SS type A sorting domain-containing protein [Bacteroidales bacterium]